MLLTAVHVASTSTSAPDADGVWTSLTAPAAKPDPPAALRSLLVGQMLADAVDDALDLTMRSPFSISPTATHDLLYHITTFGALKRFLKFLCILSQSHSRNRLHCSCLTPCLLAMSKLQHTIVITSSSCEGAYVSWRDDMPKMQC
jgi:hypothetical protein